MSIMISTPEGIAFARLAALNSALSLQAKGLRLSRGVSATSIGKAQYGLTGQAARQHQITSSIIGDIFKVREYDLIDEAGTLFVDILNTIIDRPAKITESSINGQIARGDIRDEELVAVLEALGRIWLFEQPQRPAFRVMFR